MDKKNIAKIYEYLTKLSKAHDSSSHKYNGYSLYEPEDKKKCYSVQKYKWDDNDFYKFYLWDVDFNHSHLFSSEREHERIKITITIKSDMSGLDIHSVTRKSEADLREFFTRLDRILNRYEVKEDTLVSILESRG